MIRINQQLNLFQFVKVSDSKVFQKWNLTQEFTQLLKYLIFCIVNGCVYHVKFE